MILSTTLGAAFLATGTIIRCNDLTIPAKKGDNTFTLFWVKTFSKDIKNGFGKHNKKEKEFNSELPLMDH